MAEFRSEPELFFVLLHMRLSRYFLPQFKNLHFSLISQSKLPWGVTVCMYDCMLPCDESVHGVPSLSAID